MPSNGQDQARATRPLQLASGRRQLASYGRHVLVWWGLSRASTHAPGGTPCMAINYGNDPTISYFIFEHKGGTPLKVTDIGIVMSQACDPFTGIFARMAWDDEDNFLADVKDAEDLIRPVTEQINPNRRKEEQIIYDEDSTECQFLDVVVEGTVNREDDRIKALICSNEGEPITVKIKFYVPTPILNLRAKS